jgi:hypothetical protein
LGATLLLVGACGSATRPSAPAVAATATPAEGVTTGPNPGGTPAAALTNQDSGRTLELPRGAVVSISLQEANGFSIWSPVASTDGSVLAPMVDTRRAAVRGATLATFKAAAPGQARLNSKAACAAQGCSSPEMGWNVTVDVT